jgi:hypothetical protein
VEKAALEVTEETLIVLEVAELVLLQMVLVVVAAAEELVVITLDSTMAEGAVTVV